MSGASGVLDAKEVRWWSPTPPPASCRCAAEHGDGTWRVEGLVLPLPGTWKVRLDILINDYEMARIEGDIAIGH